MDQALTQVVTAFAQSMQVTINLDGSEEAVYTIGQKRFIKGMNILGQTLGVINAVAINTMIGGSTMAWFTSMGINASFMSGGDIGAAAAIMVTFGVFAGLSSLIWTRAALGEGFANLAKFFIDLQKGTIQGWFSEANKADAKKRRFFDSSFFNLYGAGLCGPSGHCQPKHRQ